MLLTIAPEWLKTGLSVAALIVRNVDGTRVSPELLAYRRAYAKQLAEYWKNRSLSAHPVFAEYHRLHTLAGVASEFPAPEKLLLYVRRNHDFAASGSVVDCYNLVSARTLLAIGAHDFDALRTPVVLRTLTAKDTFKPLGSPGHPGPAEGYGYVNDDGRIVCWLDVLQCEDSKVTRTSKDIVFFIQGNRYLSPAVMLKGAWLLAEMMMKFCGAEAELVDFNCDFGAQVPLSAPKPNVSFSTFQRMRLRAGTVAGSSQLGNLALSSVTVETNGEEEALVPSAAAAGLSIGRRVVVAVGLPPLKVCGQSFSAYLPAIHGANGFDVPQRTDAIPAGTALL